MTTHLRTVPTLDGWDVQHIPSGERIATFRTWEGAQRFVEDIAPLDWSFQDPLRTPMATWAGLLAAFSRRGIEITPNWKLRETVNV